MWEVAELLGQEDALGHVFRCDKVLGDLSWGSEQTKQFDQSVGSRGCLSGCGQTGGFDCARQAQPLAWTTLSVWIYFVPDSTGCLSDCVPVRQTHPPVWIKLSVCLSLSVSGSV